METSSQACELCSKPGGAILWQSGSCRVVRVDDAHYPGFCRVIWAEHIREMSDLAPSDRQNLMNVVFSVEAVIRRLFAPDKINLASFGNMVPHLHWHVIPRWYDDRHFPEPVWGAVQRPLDKSRPVISDAYLAQALASALANTGLEQAKP